MTRTYRRCPYRPCWSGGSTIWEDALAKASARQARRRWSKDRPWKQGRVWLHHDGSRCDVQWRKSGDFRRTRRRARCEEARLLLRDVRGGAAFAV